MKDSPNNQSFEAAYKSNNKAESNLESKEQSASDIDY